MKKLTIIIPCYNMESFIEVALNSILNQDDQENFCDVYIIDDGSKDNSISIINNFINSNKLKNFHLIKKENNNWGSVINYAKNKLNINSKYITILDADDYYSNNLFKTINEPMNKEYDLVFTGFYEVKRNRIKKGYITPQKGNKLINKKYMRFPSLIPLCKFFKTKLFLELDDLIEKKSYQDIILWNKFIDIAKTFYYVKKPYGYYLNHREGASSTMAFTKERVTILVDIINELISDDVFTNGYLMALLMHLKKNTPKKNRKYIKLNSNYKKIRKFKLLWCPFGSRIIVKICMFIYLFRLLKTGKFA